MTQEELNQQALKVYAAIGELTIRRKQFKQQIKDLDSKLQALEEHVVKLSLTKVEEEPSNV